MKRISIKAVLLSNITALLTEMILLPLLVVVLSLHVMPNVAGMSFDQGSAAITAALKASPWMKGLPWVVGISASILGGYVSARIAKHDELLNGALSALYVVVFGCYYLAVHLVGISVLKVSLRVTSQAAGGLFGGYLGIRVRQRKTAPSE